MYNSLMCLALFELYTDNYIVIIVYVGIENTPHILKPYLHVRTLIHAQYTLYLLSIDVSMGN